MPAKAWSNLISTFSHFLIFSISYSHIPTLHSFFVFPQFEIVREKFGQRIKALQYRYEGVGNRKFGGVTVLATGKDIQRTAIFGTR